MKVSINGEKTLITFETVEERKLLADLAWNHLDSGSPNQTADSFANMLLTKLGEKI